MISGRTARGRVARSRIRDGLGHARPGRIGPGRSGRREGVARRRHAPAGERLEGEAPAGQRLRPVGRREPVGGARSRRCHVVVTSRSRRGHVGVTSRTARVQLEVFGRGEPAYSAHGLLLGNAPDAYQKFRRVGDLQPESIRLVTCARRRLAPCQQVRPAPFGPNKSHEFGEGDSSATDVSYWAQGRCMSS